MSGNCLNFQIGLCEGACSGHEDVATYNIRAQKAIEKLKLDFDGSFLVVEEGRSRAEEAVILIEDGEYKGFGYVNKEDVSYFQDYLDCIKSFQNNPDSQSRRGHRQRCGPAGVPSWLASLRRPPN